MADDKGTDVKETEVEETDAEDVETEPTLEEMKASIAKLERAVAKANREAARLRTEKKASETKSDDSKSDEKEAEKQADARYKRVAVAAAARAELKDAGFSGTKEQAAKLSRLLDLDDLDVNDDGTIDGLEDAVEELKEQFPALFSASAVEEKPKAPKVESGPKPVRGSIQTAADPIAQARYERLFGGGGKRSARR